MLPRLCLEWRPCSPPRELRTGAPYYTGAPGGTNRQRAMSCILGKEEEQRTTQRGQRTETAIEGVEDPQGKLSSCRDVSGHSGLREHADGGERVGKGRNHLRGPRCPYSKLHRGIPESQSSGWCPVWLTAKNLALLRAEKGKTPKVDRQGRVGGSRRVCRRLTLVFLVLTFAWGYHLLSPANSLAGRQPSQPATDG